jgi:SAM-dependent methyltransferase
MADKDEGGSNDKALKVHERVDPEHVFTDFDSINEFDRETWEVTKELPIRTGSILRVPSSAYHRFRIGITDENREQLKEKADEYRQKDYDEREKDRNIGKAEKTEFSVSMRNSMIRAMVRFAKEIITAEDDGQREFRIVDLTTGLGHTVTSIASALFAGEETRSILERTSFYLVDYSKSKLGRVEEALNRFDPAKVETFDGRDEDFLSTTSARFDIVLSLCHFHKKPFLEDVLASVHKVLSKKGVLVSGDWHSSLCNHPIYVLQLLEMMGLETHRIKLFKGFFKEFLDRSSNPDIMIEEIKAVSEHQEYWADIHHRLVSHSQMSMRERHFALGAFDTTRNRVELMEKSNLITDPEKIRRAFPKTKIPLSSTPMRMISGTDRASVIMAMRGKPK